jgi:hypothetical protein
VPASPLLRGLPADTAEAVALVPTDLRPALRHNPGRFRAEVRRRAAGLLKLPGVAKMEFIKGFLDVGDVQGKMGNAILKAEKHRRDAHMEGFNGRRAEPSKLERRLGLDQDIELTEWQNAALRMFGLGIEPRLITALCIAAIKRVTGKDMWFHSRTSSVLIRIVGHERSCWLILVSTPATVKPDTVLTPWPQAFMVLT